MLKFALPTAGTWLAAALPALAQQPAPPVALSLSVVNSYHVPAANSRLVSYYALGSKIQVVLHDTWRIGFSQLSSLAPRNLLPAPGLSPGNTRLAEYAVHGGGKWPLASRTYVLGNLQVGLGTLRSGGSPDQEGPAGGRASFLTAGADAGLGYQVTPFLALEAGAGYHRYFRGHQLPVAPKELPNVSVQLSLVGTLPLTKPR
jgi:hypothetical protein